MKVFKFLPAIFTAFMLWAGGAQAQVPQTLVYQGVTYTLCGLENGNCTWTGGGSRYVVFGDAPPDAPSQMLTRSVTAVPTTQGCYLGGINWSNGNTDPAPGYDKACWSAAGTPPPPAPTVTLSASPTTITKGQSSVLTLTSSNATSCSGAFAATSGQQTVTPAATTTYSETCTGAGGSTTKTAVVTVNQTTPAPTVKLVASPASITKGQSATLTWSSTNATTCSGVGGGTSGTVSVSPQSTTTYSETCSGATSPPATSTATVTVSAVPAPTATLTASPSSISAGGSSTLTLTSSNATSCTGPVSGTSGTAVVNPTQTTTYTETCTGTTSPPAVATTTVTVGSQSGMTFTPTTTAGGSPPTSGVISADTPDPLNLRIFGNGAQFNINVSVNVASADTVTWGIQNDRGAMISQGSFAVPAGVSNTVLKGSSTVSGFFAFTATTNAHGGVLPSRGTQPTGYITFGVQPPAGLVPAVTFTSPDQHRIGMQGCNSSYACLQALGVKQVIDDREQSWGEPNGPNTYTPSVSDLDPFFVQHTDIQRLVRLDGIPAWNDSQGGVPFNDSYRMPTNLTEYGQYMAKVGTDTSLIRAQYYPTQVSNYYQVTWEPSLAWPQTGGTAGKNSPADFVNLYKTVYQALHSTDTRAVVMGPAEPFANNNDSSSGGRITNSPGLCTWLDGVATHAYYNAPTVPSNPPELQDGDPVTSANSLANEMKGLRSTMQSCKPNMKLFNTELGISYDAGVSYAAVTPNHLYAHGAVGLRSHLIVLGEGAQVTYFFYGTDFPDNIAGYGAFFDLDNANGGFGDSTWAPKPEAMAFAAMSRIIDGTNTLGSYNLPVCAEANGCVHAYAFQQLGNGAVISALWFHKNSSWNGPSSFSQTVSTTYNLQVDAAGASGTVKVIDAYGNATQKPYTNGAISLTLTELPIYVVSSNATLTKTLVTAPVGYLGQ